MIRGSAWAISWLDVLTAVAVLAVLVGWFILTSPRARTNRAKLRARRRHNRILRSIR